MASAPKIINDCFCFAGSSSFPLVVVAFVMANLTPSSRFSSFSVLFVLHPMVRAHLSLHLSCIVTVSHHCSDTFIFSISHRLLCPARTAFVGTVSVFVMQLVFVSAATG